MVMQIMLCTLGDTSFRALEHFIFTVERLNFLEKSLLRTVAEWTNHYLSTGTLFIHAGKTELLNLFRTVAG